MEEPKSGGCRRLFTSHVTMMPSALHAKEPAGASVDGHDGRDQPAISQDYPTMQAVCLDVCICRTALGSRCCGYSQPHPL